MTINPAIYPPAKINAIIRLVGINIAIELLLLAFLLIVFKLTPRFKKAALIIPLIAELFIFSRGNLFTAPASIFAIKPPPLPVKTDRYLSASDTQDYLGPHVYWNHLRVRQPFAPDLKHQELQQFSVLSQELLQLPGNLNLLFGWYNASGYSAVVLASYARYLDSSLVNSIQALPPDDPRLAFLGVNYLITGYPQDYFALVPGFTKIIEGPQIIYRRLTPQSRFHFLSGTGTLHQSSIGPNEITLTASTPNPDTLIVADSFYPGWQATLDGQPITIYPYQDAFRAISLPSGVHSLTLRYSPQSVKIGAALSLISLIFCLLLLVWPKQKLPSLS